MHFCTYTTIYTYILPHTHIHILLCGGSWLVPGASQAQKKATGGTSKKQAPGRAWPPKAQRLPGAQIEETQSVCVYMYMYICTYIYVHMCMCMYMYMYMYTDIYVYIYMFRYIYMYVCVCMYIYIHIRITTMVMLITIIRMIIARIVCFLE